MEVKKRIIGTIIIQDEWAIQSISYQKYLPLGHPWVLAENLDRWGADEILILSIDRSKKRIGPDLEVLSRIANRVNTPLIYGGGIKNLSDALNTVHAGADRIVVDSLFRESFESIQSISDVIGSQAIILSLPLIFQNNSLYLYDYLTKSNLPFLSYKEKIKSSDCISELLVIDQIHEGEFHSFDTRILEQIDLEIPLILFGGISEETQLISLIQNKKVSALGIGNFLNYKELSIQRYKKALENVGITRQIYLQKNK